MLRQTTKTEHYNINGKKIEIIDGSISLALIIRINDENAKTDLQDRQVALHLDDTVYTACGDAREKSDSFHLTIAMISPKLSQLGVLNRIHKNAQNTLGDIKLSLGKNDALKNRGSLWPVASIRDNPALTQFRGNILDDLDQGNISRDKRFDADFKPHITLTCSWIPEQQSSQQADVSHSASSTSSNPTQLHIKSEDVQLTMKVAGNLIPLTADDLEKIRAVGITKKQPAINEVFIKINSLEEYGRKLGEETSWGKEAIAAAQALRRGINDLYEPQQPPAADENGYVLASTVKTSKPDKPQKKNSKEFLDLANKYSQTLGQKRDDSLNHILANIALAFTGIGFIAQVTNLCLNGRFCFFFSPKTTREKHLDNIINVYSDLTKTGAVLGN